MTKQSPYMIESLHRGLQVLSLFTRETDSLTLTQIKETLDLNKTTVFRIVSTLESTGYLKRDPQTKRYRPGLKVLQLGFAAISSLEFRQIARPYLERLSIEVGQTASLSVLDGMEVVYVDRVRRHQVLGVILGLGSRIPAYCASLGKVALAYLPADELRRRLEETELVALTPHTMTTREALEEDLALVRQRGYSINDEEWILGLRSTAAPIFNDQDEVIAAINVSVSAAEVTRDRLENEIAPVVQATAQEISDLLGNVPL